MPEGPGQGAEGWQEVTTSVELGREGGAGESQAMVVTVSPIVRVTVLPGAHISAG